MDEFDDIYPTLMRKVVARLLFFAEPRSVTKSSGDELKQTQKLCGSHR